MGSIAVYLCAKRNDPVARMTLVIHKREITAASPPVNEEEWGPGSRWRDWHDACTGTICNLQQERAQHIHIDAGGWSV